MSSVISGEDGKPRSCKNHRTGNAKFPGSIPGRFFCLPTCNKIIYDPPPLYATGIARLRIGLHVFLIGKYISK